MSRQQQDRAPQTYGLGIDVGVGSSLGYCSDNNGQSYQASTVSKEEEEEDI